MAEPRVLIVAIVTVIIFPEIELFPRNKKVGYVRLLFRITPKFRALKGKIKE